MGWRQGREIHVHGRTLRTSHALRCTLPKPERDMNESSLRAIYSTTSQPHLNVAESFPLVRVSHSCQRPYCASDGCFGVEDPINL